MNKKAAISTVVAFVIAGALLVILILIAIVPTLKKGEEFYASYGGKCKETGITMDEYQFEIENSIKELASQTSDEKKEDIFELYKEYIKCFPDNNLAAVMEDLSEKEVYGLISVLKEKKYYDKTAINIATRFVKRFPSSSNLADVNSYINEAKTAKG